MVSRKTAKSRGSAAERELLHKLYDNGWGAVRAAGSGSIPLDVPDIIAGNRGRSLGIEVKYCTGDRQYLRDQEIKDLNGFAFRFGCEAWIGVKFSRRGWHFIRAVDLKSSGKHFVVAHANCEEDCISFEKLIEKKKY